MTPRTTVLFAILASISLAHAGVARAQSADDRAAAQALFDEGLRLFNSGDYPGACAKLEASLALVDGIGTRGKLAECYEKAGRTASAWGAYREVAVLAKREGQTKRQQVAEARARALESQLAFLTISAADTPGLEVTRDGVGIQSGAFGTPIAVDPRAHKIEAKAPGYEPWSQEITVAPRGKETVEVPALVKLPEPPPDPVGGRVGAGGDVAARGPRGPNVKRIAGITAVSVGGASVVVGLIFGIKARSDYNKAFDEGLCSETDNRCNREGQDLTESAHTSATVATIFVVGGLVAASAGTYLWLTSGGDDDDQTTVQIAPAAGPDAVGVSLSGRF